MPRFIIVSHAHHADEGVYRLVFAEAADMEGETVLVNQRDVVWSDSDPKWADRDPEDIAREQRKVLRDVLARRVSEKEAAEARRAQAMTDLGGAGQEF